MYLERAYVTVLQRLTCLHCPIKYVQTNTVNIVQTNTVNKGNTVYFIEQSTREHITMTEEMSKTGMDPNDSELAWEEDNNTKDNQDATSASTRKSKKGKSNGWTALKRNTQGYKQFRENNNISVRKSRLKTKEKQQALREEIQALRKEISELIQGKETMLKEKLSLEAQLYIVDWDVHYLEIVHGRAKPDNCPECQIRSHQRLT